MPDWLTGPWGRACLVVVGFVACGALAGVIWNAWWEPPSGVAYQGMWLLDPAGPDVALSGTALYVALAFPVGLVLGVVVSAVPRHEVATLVGVVVGSALAAWVMYSIGHLLGPPDPRVLAAGEADFTTSRQTSWWQRRRHAQPPAISRPARLAPRRSHRIGRELSPRPAHISRAG
ncbi:hypothetical protein EXE58_00010 [Nocardioides seonyuensis]|uniref:DUF2567 domain-containing protein n=1 Tax=Nocardioides seonyuensis TaxID=2518371 RepID=A0A4P7IBT3_9ACTN|nr:hypothetical protein [Nocardioides seonyuensis]QBX54020.1 hypothetical protein EXE58_00010 [Nocardioides seonyuensis]